MELIIIFITSLFLRLPFLSNWLEDWDSVQFAMALHKFDLLHNIPHAPGYPLYILFGKFLLLFAKDDTTTLTLLSALLGSLSIVFIYLLAKEMFDKKVAVIASIFAIFIPVHFLLSESALTNIPGLFSLTLFAYLLYKYNSQKLILLSFLGGLILGMRFTEVPIILTLLLLTFLKKPDLKRVPLYISSFILGLCTWIVPITLITGLNNFIHSYSWIATYIIKHDVGTNHILRISRLSYLFNLGYTKVFLIALTLSLVWLLTKKTILKDFRFQFLMVWIISYFVPLALIYNLEVTRYTLPLVPPFVIILSYFLTSQKNKYLKILSFVTFTVVIGFLAKESFNQARIFKNEVPPSIQPIGYVEKNFSPKNTIVIASYIYRQFEYYAPEFKSYYENAPTAGDLSGIKYVVIDYVGLTQKLPKDMKYKIINTVEFNGNKDVYTRLPKVTLYTLELDNE